MLLLSFFSLDIFKWYFSFSETEKQRTKIAFFFLFCSLCHATFFFACVHLFAFVCVCVFCCCSFPFLFGTISHFNFLSSSLRFVKPVFCVCFFYYFIGGSHFSKAGYRPFLPPVPVFTIRSFASNATIAYALTKPEAKLSPCFTGKHATNFSATFFASLQLLLLSSHRATPHAAEG